ncbi:MAG TPA: hypothetical protein VM367_15665 [Pseudonocardia sp.]|nr:hypothetical protein [Pseudonocardia sp.]
MQALDVAALAATVLARPAVGRIRLVTVDGLSGSGKTRLAGALAAALAGTPVVHLDDLYPGWNGLLAGVRYAAEQVAAPLVAGRTARWRRWDWARGARGAWSVTAPAPVVLLEGCGAGAPPLRACAATSIWIETPAQLRELRLRARADWAAYAAHRATWVAQEEALAATGRAAESADVVVDGA